MNYSVEPVVDVQAAQPCTINEMWRRLMQRWRADADRRLAQSLREEQRPIDPHRFQYLFLASLLDNEQSDAALAGPRRWDEWIGQRRSLCTNERLFLGDFAQLSASSLDALFDAARQLTLRYPALIREPEGAGIVMRLSACRPFVQ